MSSKVKPLLIFLLFIMVAPVWSQQMTSEEIDNRIKQDSGDAKKCLKQLTKLCPNQKFGPPCFKQVMPTLPPRCGEILGSNFGS
ncbi:MAG: hypothetical protein HN623_02110, partial [Bdellovibrionales bacterium]|nr:hypothetical protein [Bdellovibrionales bacterium]